MYTVPYMNREAIMYEFASKPKINRLPLPQPHPQERNEYVSDDRVIWWSMWSFSSFALLILVLIGYQYSVGLSDKAVISPDDVRLMALVNSVDDITKREDSSVYFKDHEGIIVGQMVKIASESEEMIPDKLVNSGDKPTERELLAILSKY